MNDAQMRRRKPMTVIKSEYKEKTLDLRRVARVVSGGKRFSFRCAMAIGNEKGKVGMGVEKGKDVAQAMQKAKNKAQKNLISVPLKETTIPHEVRAKFSAARVLIRPARKGSGLKAGGAVRIILSLAGIQDATSKCLGRTKNKLTNALAAIEALKKLSKQNHAVK